MEWIGPYSELNYSMYVVAPCISIPDETMAPGRIHANRELGNKEESNGDCLLEHRFSFPSLFFGLPPRRRTFSEFCLFPFHTPCRLNNF